MKLIQRIQGPTPLKWKKIMLYVSSLCGALGLVVLAIPSWWIHDETKNFIFALLGFIATFVTGFSQTRVKKSPEEL